jgi:hypothetical protein
MADDADNEVLGATRKDWNKIFRVVDHLPGSVSQSSPITEDVGLVLAYTTGATARSGSVLGTGTATVQSIATATRSDWTTPSGGTWTVDYLNLAAASLAAGYVILAKERISGKWLCIWDDCA